MDDRERERLGRAMAALADGERDAFATVFRSVKPLLERYIAKVVGDVAARDELVQTSLIKVFEQASRFDPERDAAAWVLALASWEVRSFRRDRARQRLKVGGEPIDAAREPGDDPEGGALRREIITAVHECLGELSALDQEVILTTLAEERLNTPNFRKRLERALARFKSRWVSRHEHDAS